MIIVPRNPILIIKVSILITLVGGGPTPAKTRMQFSGGRGGPKP